jgi:hypothetical protein
VLMEDLYMVFRPPHWVNSSANRGNIFPSDTVEDIPGRVIGYTIVCFRR